MVENPRRADGRNNRDIPDSIHTVYESTDHYDVRVRTHALYSIVKQSWVEWLLKQISQAGVDTVLDLGCGTGGLLHRLASEGIDKRLLGIDQSEAMVK